MNANETLFDTVTQIGSSPNSTIYEVCLHFQPNINSDGIWGDYSGNAFPPMRSSVPVLELQLIVIFLVTQLCYLILRHLGCPLLVSQMLAGLILGPSLHLGSLHKYKKMLFPYGSQDIIATFTSLGYAFFMFLTGVQMDFTMITRTGKKAWIIAFTMTATPLVLGYYSVFQFMPRLVRLIGKQVTDLFVTFISHSITSFAVIANLLTDLKIINSELGRLALSTALVSDMLSTCFTSLATGIVRRLDDKPKILANIVSLFAFFVLIPLLCRPAMRWVIRQTPEGRPVKEAYIYTIIAMVLCMGMLAIQLDQEFYLGAFILGLAVPEGAPLGSALVKKLELFGTWFLLPIFVTTCLMKADLSLDYTKESIGVIGVFILGAHLVKMLACLIPSLSCKMSIKDAFALAIILNCKGVVEVCSYNAMYDKKNINAQTYGMLMVSIMIIASIVPVAVKYLYDPSRKYAGFQKRNIMNSKQNTDLRMLCCIHKQFHINAIIDFLDIICPTVDNTITMDALHLVELVGRFSPIFISHRRQGVVSGASFNSYSENLNLAFSIYEHEHLGVATVNTYTAISPVSLMHEDVCYLALDKLSSVIILPFHKRWSKNAEIEDDDKNVGFLNSKVLERAPCSVAILVSRASVPSNPISRLAVVFLGGEDDCEALCLAKRAMMDPRINLVVYHLVGIGDIAATPNTDGDMLEKTLLKDFQRADSGSNVSYQKLTVLDGPELSSILRAMAMEHDFFIVGNRHDLSLPYLAGIQDWIEFPELGVIGDMLSSPDFESDASVLVVQQQKMCK